MLILKPRPVDATRRSIGNLYAGPAFALRSIAMRAKTDDFMRARMEKTRSDSLTRPYLSVIEWGKGQ